MTLTIATWNLENLFLPGSESGPPDQETFERKLDALAATITEIAPDVLAVQEVGDAAGARRAAHPARGRVVHGALA